MTPLEYLCNRFAKERSLSLEKERETLYAKKNNLEIFYTADPNFNLFGVDQSGQCILGLFAAKSPSVERELAIRITAVSLPDYLTLLRRSDKSFVKTVREKFQPFLGQLHFYDSIAQAQFMNPSYKSIIYTLDALFPTTKKR